MSTNKTPNYQLHSWLPSDEFHVSEINENFAALDGAVAGKADTATVSALGQAMGALQGWASTACVAGSAVISNYQQELALVLGFRPKLVLMQMMTNTHYVIRFCTEESYGSLTAQHNFSTNISVNQECLLTDTGFRVPSSFLTANDNNRTKLHYVAFG